MDDRERELHEIVRDVRDRGYPLAAPSLSRMAGWSRGNCDCDPGETRVLARETYHMLRACNHIGISYVQLTH